MSTATECATECQDFLVNRADLRATETIKSPLPALADGEVLMHIDRFAFTANNVTYAAFGVAMRYWDFFPAPDGYGRVPVWGFADVTESRHPDIKVGERFYGYYPMSSHLIVRPARCTAAGFTDGVAHRRDLPVIYNQYVRTSNDPAYSRAGEATQMVFRPLFMTSFLIDDFLDDNDFFGARQIILSSASSKTSFCLAYLLGKRPGTQVIGLTSRGNMDFVRGLGCYHQVVDYDNIASLDPTIASVFVDMAGSGPVRHAVHARFDDMLKYSCSVGASHWDDMGSNKDLKGPKPTLFFAPAQGQKRAADWGVQGLQDRSGKAWQDFTAHSGGWLRFIEHRGQTDMARIYLDTVDGKVSPNEGHILGF